METPAVLGREALLALSKEELVDLVELAMKAHALAITNLTTMNGLLASLTAESNAFIEKQRQEIADLKKDEESE